VEKKLYVGNLSYDTTDSELEHLFAQAGSVVEASVAMDRTTGRSRGFGFVEMADETAAAAAIEQFNGKELDGRTLKVDEARPRAARENRGYGGGNGGGRNSRW
jgi:cold-inducible RNA-binding protein